MLLGQSPPEEKTGNSCAAWVAAAAEAATKAATEAALAAVTAPSSGDDCSRLRFLELVMAASDCTAPEVMPLVWSALTPGLIGAASLHASAPRLPEGLYRGNAPKAEGLCHTDLPGPAGCGAALIGNSFPSSFSSSCLASDSLTSVAG